MTRPRRIAASLIGLLTCAAAVWFWLDGAGPQKAVTIDAEAGRRAEVDEPAGAGRSEAAEGLPSSPNSDEGRQGTARTQVEKDRRVRITGRCITVEGQAIRDCRISVVCYERVDQGRSHRTVRPEKPTPPARTDEEGRFAIRIRPVEGWHYSLRLDIPGRADYRGDLGPLKQGELQDLGEIPMLPGARIRGLVLDEQGKPVADCQLGLLLNRKQKNALAAQEPRFYPFAASSTKTDSTGRFDLRNSLCAGAWELELDREKISPEEVVIRGSRIAIDVEIRVRSLREEDLIRGRVVDEAGQAIHGAEMAWFPRTVSGRFSFQDRIYTHKDGSFRILRSKTDTGVPVRLRVDKKGFDRLESQKPIEWGTSDLRLVMKHGTTLAIQVLDAETRKPVEDYGLRIRPLGSGPLIQGLQYRDEHEGGILRIPGMAKGRYEIMVVPGEGHLDSRWKEVGVSSQIGASLLFELHRVVHQELRVVTARGHPVVGTQVELLEAEKGLPIDAKTFALSLSGWSSSNNRARLWTEGRTDDQGRLTLSGPPTRELGLRVSGRDHVPLSVNGIRLTKGGAPIQVQVQVGASIRGRIHPWEALQALDSLGSHLNKDLRQMKGFSWKAGLKLYRSSPSDSYPSGSSARFPIGKDGSFHIQGIAPGTWTLQLVWIRGSRYSYRAQHLDLEPLTVLKDGEERKLEFDISRFLLGKIQGTVFQNGALLDGGTLQLQARKDSLPEGISRTFFVSAGLDENGRFEVSLIPGVYDCTVRLQSKGGFQPSYPTENVLRVTAGSKQQTRLDLRTADLRLRFVDPDGKPLAGLRAFLATKSSQARFYLPASDRRGHCTKLAPTGIFRLLLPPKKLTTREGAKAFRAQHTDDYDQAYEKALIILDTLNLSTGSPMESRTITVPDKAGY